jgi:uncharacterized YigZ family protein
MDYLTLGGAAEVEYVINRSRFIGWARPVASVEAANDFVSEMRARHREATHNVYAYCVREPEYSRYSDDGEPQGTAGIPMLEVFRREGVTDLVCVVPRYFGGVLRGAGGLFRAYTKSAKDALDDAGKAVVRRWVVLGFPCSYAALERMKLEIASFGGAVEKVEYGAAVEIRALLSEEKSEAFQARIFDLTGGATKPAAVGESFQAVPLG